MKIAIVDADLLDGSRKHRFPNLACMKLAGWHKARGDDVHLILGWGAVVEGSSYSRVYISKVFSDTSLPDGWQSIPDMTCGGTGFPKAGKLPNEVEHFMPDYSLYGVWVETQRRKSVPESALKYFTSHSIGYTTRGCIRKCSFCINKHSSKVERHSPVKEFVNSNRPCVTLLDDNILAFADWLNVFDELEQTGLHWEFKQGLDFRLMTTEKAKALANANYSGDFIFAFDSISDKAVIERNLKTVWKPYIRQGVHKTKFYVLVGYDREDIYDERFWLDDLKGAFTRIRILFRHGCYPYIMRHSNSDGSRYSWFYGVLSMWCNQIRVVEHMSFYEVYKLRCKPTPIFDELLRYKWFRDDILMWRDDLCGS